MIHNLDRTCKNVTKKILDNKFKKIKCFKNIYFISSQQELKKTKLKHILLFSDIKNTEII